MLAGQGLDRTGLRKEGFMDVWEGLLAGPRGDFPRGPAPSSGLPTRPWIVVLLLLACLTPRIVAAWNWHILWGDSLRFRYASILLEQGDFEHGFAEFGLNVYPLILIPLRHLGIDWQITGKYFGVVLATLTVLPLWGWLRRMFDDRLAIFACLIYALHGKLIAVSPLILRDSTFWFLLVLTLYYVWRAMGELRIGLFLAAGVALTLAVHTRTEGWLLLIPLVGWGACRWMTACGKRFHLVVGTLLTIAVIPASVALVNLTWLRQNPRWEFLRTAHIGLAVDWWNAATGMHLAAPLPDSAPPRLNATLQRVPLPTSALRPAGKPIASTPPPFTSIVVPEAVPPELTTSSGTLTYKMLERLAKGCTWVGSVLLLTGLVCGWRILLRPEHLALLGLTVLLLVLTRVRYGIAGMDQRYFMPIVIFSVAWMALGLDYLLAGARRLAQQRGELSSRASRMLAGSLIAVAIACTLLDGSISIPAYMRTHSDLGRWVCRRVGPEPSMAGNIDEMSLETFYANAQVAGIFWPRDCLMVPLPAVLTEQSADVVVLWNDDNNVARKYLPIIEQRITGYCGYRRVDNQELPASENELMVFVRK